MNLIRLLLLLLLLPAVDGVRAAEVLELTDGQSASVRISARDLTRIAMTGGGRVAKVIGLSSEVSVEPDEEAGQVFIRPAARQSEAFTLHVRDDGGATYTLLAIPVAELAGDTVFIRPAGGRRPVESIPPSQEPRTARIKRWLRALERGDVPQGTMLEHLGQWRESQPGTRLRLTGRVVGASWKAEIYTLHNVSGTELTLTETEFRGLGERLLAIALESHRLVSGQRTRLFVLQANE